MSKILAARLKAARHQMNPLITQKEVARRFKVTPGAVCLWERGTTEPSAGALVELARMYGVSTDWLLGLQEHRPRSSPVGPPIHTVPVVTARALARWRWDAVLELLQTSVSYAPNSAAAIMVSSDALTSTCPTGSYAVVSRAQSPSPGSVVLVSVGKVSEPILRRYVQEAGERLLIADDSRWPTMRLDPTAKIIGTVVEVTLRRRLA
jgi:SOS-response transcriptional repressor LexA